MIISPDVISSICFVGSSVSEKVNDVFDMVVTVIESSTSLYKVTLSIKICYIKDVGCQTFTLAEEVTLVRPSCASGRKRKRKKKSIEE